MRQTIIQTSEKIKKDLVLLQLPTKSSIFNKKIGNNRRERETTSSNVIVRLSNSPL